MFRFFFDTCDGARTFYDEEGMLLADDEAARHQAMIALPDIARDVVPKDGDRRDMMVDVRNEGGQVVFTATLSLVARWIR